MNDNQGSTLTNLRDAPLNKEPDVFVASWRSLEEGLTLLAGTPERGQLVSEAVSALRKSQAAGEPSSKILLRILAATAFLTDDRPLGGTGAMS
jgi:hypothetical protein